MEDYFKTLVIGTCVPTDILKSVKNELWDNNRVVVWEHLQHFKGEIDYKISALTVPPGLIAERLYHAMGKTIHKQTHSVQRQYNAIVKPVSMNDIETMIRANNAVVIMDLHGEIYRTYDNGFEYFGILPGFEKIQHHFPTWLIDMIHVNQRSVAEMTAYDINKRYDLLVDVGRRLSSSANDRVILFDNVFSDNIYDEDSDLSVKLYSMPQEKRGPFISFNEDMSESMLDLMLFKRLYRNLYKRVTYRHPKWQLVSVNPDYLMSDLRHPHGWHPCHLHKKCFHEFRAPLLKAFSEVTLIPPPPISIIVP